MATSPTNIKPLYGPGNSNFSVVKFPEIDFFVQDTELPSMTLGHTMVSTSVNDVPVPGEMISFEPLTCSFIVDEKMSNYMTIHSWMVGMGFPVNHDMYKNLMAQSNSALVLSELDKGYTDGILTILGNNNRQIMQATFADCFPINLSGIRFSSTSSDSTPMTATVTFMYAYYLLKAVT